MEQNKVISFHDAVVPAEILGQPLHPYDPGAVRHISMERIAELSNDIYLQPVPQRTGLAG